MPSARKTFHGSAYRSFRQKLKSARATAKMTQRDVAKSLGRPPSYVAKIEMGERRVDVIELQILARLYKKPLSFFVD